MRPPSVRARPTSHAWTAGCCARVHPLRLSPGWCLRPTS